MEITVTVGNEAVASVVDKLVSAIELILGAFLGALSASMKGKNGEREDPEALFGN